MILWEKSLNDKLPISITLFMSYVSTFFKRLLTQLKAVLNHIIIITITKILAERRCSDTTLVGEVTSEPPTALNTIILMGIQVTIEGMHFYVRMGDVF